MSSLVTILEKPSCMQCTMTKRRMDDLGIEYDTIDMTEREAALEWALDQGFQQAPIVVVGDMGGEDFQAWPGFDPDRIQALAGE